MFGVNKKKTIENVETILGNAIIKDCLANGWSITSEYSKKMIDKGIDFDSYTISRNKQNLFFTWSNWDEWEIVGTEDTINWLIEAYSLASNQKGNDSIKK